jgi:threonine/homoserine/homoserine lactone efflux protein
VIYLEQFLLIVVVHFLAVASPGPDFAIILKQSIRYNRITAIFTSLGIACGIMLHVTYSLVGIGLIIASDERLFTALKYIAAGYFCYVAWHGLRAKKPDEKLMVQQSNNDNYNKENEKNAIADSVDAFEEVKTQTKIKAFLTGFLINGLNVKATLFFVSLFSIVIPLDTPLNIKIAYGLYMVLATGAWFIFLSCLLTHQKVSGVIQRYGYILDRIMGAVLLLLAINIVFFD